jgi:hypothetical protein
MADFTFTSPEGRSYTVSGPEGATAAQAWGILQGNIGQQAPAAPQTESGIFERMAADLHNQRAAASQGTTPVISAHMPNLLSDRVEVGDDNNLYFKDASGRLQPTDTNKHVVLRDPEDQRLKVFSRTADTDEGRAASLGRLLAPGMGAGNIEMAGLNAAGRIGVDVPRAIQSNAPFIKQIGQISAKAPGGGPMYSAVERGLEQLGGATERAAGMAGGASSAEEAGASVRSGFDEFFKPRSKQVVDDLYNRVDSLVHPTATAPLDKTSEIVSDILARRQASGEPSLGKAVDTVAEAVKRPGGLTYQGIKDLRTRVGEMVDTGFLPSDVSGAELKRIYGGLSEDLKSAVQRLGGPRASSAFEVANETARAKAQYLEKLDKVIGPKTRSDEGVVGSLYRMAQKGAGADVETLSLARQALPSEAWQEVASNVIGRLGRNKAGDFSPTLFIRDYGNLSDQGRRILFHSVGAGKVVPFLNDIAEVSNKYVQAGKFGNPSGTAGHGAGLTLGGAIIAGFAEGSLKPPMVALGAVVGNNLLARALAAPATVASAAKWSRAYDRVLHSPTPQTLAIFNLTSRGLGRAMAEASGDPDRADEMTQQIQSTAAQ